MLLGLGWRAGSLFGKDANSWASANSTETSSAIVGENEIAGCCRECASRDRVIKSSQGLPRISDVALPHGDYVASLRSSVVDWRTNNKDSTRLVQSSSVFGCEFGHLLLKALKNRRALPWPGL